MVINGTDVRLKLNGKHIGYEQQITLIENNGREFIVQGLIGDEDIKPSELTTSDPLSKYLELFKVDSVGELYYKDTFIMSKNIKLVEVRFDFKCEEAATYVLKLIECIKR